jgi:DNA-binding NtrC family response regulator
MADHEQTDQDETDQQHLSSRSILIVDDDRALLDALEHALVQQGAHVVACESFAEARSMLRSRPFDAMLTDVRLGEFNGLQLALLAKDAHPTIRIVVFSGYNDPVLRAEAERLGAVYLVKPVPSSDLVEVLG